MKTGIELIAQERKKQIEKHGWSPKHDQEHGDRQLCTAALYALTHRETYEQGGFMKFEEKIKEKKYKERLIIAGALIAAEIDRLNNL